MHGKPHWPVLLSLVIAACLLVGCQASSRPSTKPTPPRVTDCLDEPAGEFPPEPADPAPGQPITDAVLLAWKLWGNRVMGVATTDRIRWRGERRCIRKMEAAGQVR